MMKIFRQSYPYNPSMRHHITTAVKFGVFILVFLLVFKPFGMSSMPTDRLFYAAGMYALITFVCLFLSVTILPLLFPSFFSEESWTTGKQIIHVAIVIVLVGVVNYLISPLVVYTTYSLRDLLWFQGITLSIASIPVIIFTLLRQNTLLKKFEQQAAVLEKKLQEKLDPAKKQELTSPPTEKKNDLTVIELTGDYHGEKIVLPPGDLFYIAAANNYVKVYFIKNGKISYSIIRMTMKKVEDALLPWPDFFRCHRAYIVNLDKVQHVEGNAQGYKIRLAGVEEAIPVSRNLNGEFSDKLLAMRGSSET